MVAWQVLVGQLGHHRPRDDKQYSPYAQVVIDC
jgi:hypothetical protein